MSNLFRQRVGEKVSYFICALIYFISLMNIQNSLSLFLFHFTIRLTSTSVHLNLHAVDEAVAFSELCRTKKKKKDVLGSVLLYFLCNTFRTTATEGKMCCCQAKLLSWHHQSHSYQEVLSICPLNSWDSGYYLRRHSTECNCKFFI